jgi:two-component system response regulator FixJ
MNDFVINIIDDDPAVLHSLKSTLDTGDVDVRTFCSAADFIRGGVSFDPCCLVLDLQMPGMNGIDLLDWLKANHLEIPFIVISGDSDIPAAVECMKRGAVDFFEKPAAPILLAKSVQLLRRISHDRTVAAVKKRKISDRFAKLTERENELLDLLAQGLSSKQMAIKLGISNRTVEAHRTRLLAKTHAPNVANLIHLRMLLADSPSIL